MTTIDLTSAPMLGLKILLKDLEINPAYVDIRAEDDPTFKDGNAYWMWDEELSDPVAERDWGPLPSPTGDDRSVSSEKCRYLAFSGVDTEGYEFYAELWLIKAVEFGGGFKWVPHSARWMIHLVKGWDNPQMLEPDEFECQWTVQEARQLAG